VDARCIAARSACAEMRSASPFRPEPFEGSAPPTPSSQTSVDPGLEFPARREAFLAECLTDSGGQLATVSSSSARAVIACSVRTVVSTSSTSNWLSSRTVWPAMCGTAASRSCGCSQAASRSHAARPRPPPSPSPAPTPRRSAPPRSSCLGRSSRSSVRAQAVVTGPAGGALSLPDPGAVLGARRHQPKRIMLVSSPT
jgi:hypothetical protein